LSQNQKQNNVFSQSPQGTLRSQNTGQNRFSHGAHGERREIKTFIVLCGTGDMLIVGANSFAHNHPSHPPRTNEFEPTAISFDFPVFPVPP